MGQLAHVPVADGINTETAVSNVKVRIQGLPEDVQWIADAIETALPGAMDWQSFASISANNLIEVNGIGLKYNDTSNIELC